MTNGRDCLKINWLNFPHFFLFPSPSAIASNDSLRQLLIQSVTWPSHQALFTLLKRPQHWPRQLPFWYWNSWITALFVEYSADDPILFEFWYLGARSLPDLIGSLLARFIGFQLARSMINPLTAGCYFTDIDPEGIFWHQQHWWFSGSWLWRKMIISVTNLAEHA